MNVTLTDEGMQNVDIYSALTAFHQGGIDIVPHLMLQGISSFLVVLSSGPPSLVVIKTKSSKIYSNQLDTKELITLIAS